MAAADTVIVLAGDLREELPVLFLRLRSAIVDGDTALVELSPRATSLTPYADGLAAVRPRRGHRAGPGPGRSEAAPVPGAVDPAALAEARRLAGAGKVVVIAGRPSLAEDGALVGEAVQVLAGSLPEARFLPALRRGNVHGCPGHGPGPRAPPRPGRPGGGARAGSPGPGARSRRRGAGTPQGILRAAAGDPDSGPPVRSLVVLGADPLGDFPDSRLAERALAGAEFVVAVASSPGPVVERADVVLPAAEAHERPGTTTNIEGRVSRLGQKLVPPGQAWPDWMIAAELAVHLGADLGLDSVGEVWDEVERVAPAYRGITRAVLDGPGAADGVVAPLVASAVSVGRRGAPQPLDPIAVPGVESVERQGAPPRAGLAESPTAAARIGTCADDRGPGPPRCRRPCSAGPVDLEVPHVAPVDSYSLRLVASRVALRPRGSGERGAGPGRSGGRRPVASEPPRPRRPRASPPGDRSGCDSRPPRWW